MEISSHSFTHIFSLSIIIIFSCFLFITCSSCHIEERTALLQFKQNFAPNMLYSNCSGTFPKLASWKNEDNCCSWEGIKCDIDTGYVIDLNLNNSCLYGSIDSNSTLFQLVHLQKLDLALNNFNYSKIPDGIGQLSELRYISLYDSRFSGQIPYAISTLRKLLVLDLSIQGDIISGESFLKLKNPDLRTLVLNLTNLKVLSLNFVDMSSSIVPDILANFSSLKYLFLSGCGLHGKFPERIFQSQSLLNINVVDNPNLHGQLPEFNSNNSLRVLWLAQTGFNGKLPFSIGNLINLTDLDIFQCRFSGSIPYSIGNLTHLNNLNLGYNMFSGPIPSSLGSLTELDLLDLGYNDFNDSSNFHWLVKQRELRLLFLPGLNLHSNVLSSFTNLTKLVLLILSDNQIEGPIPSSFCNMSSLQTLVMEHNSLTGTLPQWFENFSNSLKYLVLNDNMLEGSIPINIGNNKHLRFIDLSNNQLQGRVPRSLSSCPMLEEIIIYGNQLHDVFPSWLGNLPNLRVLVLRSNHLYGPIRDPETNFEFPKLQIIDLSCNNFSNNLPLKYINNWNAMKTFSSHSTYLRERTSLNGSEYLSYDFHYRVTLINKGSKRDFDKLQEVFSIIDLSCNKFEGEIPYSIGNLEGLFSLNLSHNMLTGHIPSSLANMKQLESLDLSYNNLSGNIPSQLWKLTFLGVFNVSFNNLSGPIPQGNQFDNALDNSSYVGNPSLCGQLLSNKCGDFERKQVSEEEKDQTSFFEFGWKIVLIGYGCGFVFGIVVGNFVVAKKQDWFLKFFRITPKRRHARIHRRNRCSFL